MKLIIGLGNPGKEYQKTRHNVGFMALDAIANYLKVEINENKFSGLYCKTTYNNEQIILLKPQKYMNLSGEVVRSFVDYFKIDIENILVISDDLDLPVGKMKLKYKGSCGGHNGLKNIEQHLNTQEYKRIKIGISNDDLIDTKDYVLGNLSKEDKNTLDNLYKELCGVVDDYFHMEFPDLMNKYNRKNR